MIPLIQRSVRWKLLIVMVGLLVVFAITLTIIHAMGQNRISRQAVQDVLTLKKNLLSVRGEVLLHNLKRRVENDIASFNFSELAEELHTSAASNADVSHIILTELSTRTTHIHASRFAASPPLPGDAEHFALAQTTSAIREYETGQGAIMEFVEPIYFGDKVWGVLRLGYSMAAVNDEMVGIQNAMEREQLEIILQSVRISALFLFAGIVIVLFFSIRLIRPIEQLTRSALKISEGNFAATTGIDLHSKDEVGTLSRTFISMTTKLQLSYNEIKRSAEESRQTGIFLDSIVENIPHMIFVKDAMNLRFLRINRAGETLLGYRREDFIGKSDYDFFKKDMADRFTSMDRLVMQSGRISDIPEETVHTRHNGIRYLHTRKIPILDSSGNAQYLLGISEDITDLKGAAEERNLFFTHALDLMCIATLDGYFEHINQAFITTLGFTGEELLSRPFVDFVHPDDVEKTVAVSKNLSEGIPVIAFTNRYICKDGSIRWLTWNAFSSREFNKIYAVARDTTDQRIMEEEIVQAGAKEQERIAHDLHDGLGQILTGIAYKAKLIESILNDGATPAASQASYIVQLANQASEQARQLARGLDPIVLREGLNLALEQLANTTEDFFHVECFAQTTHIDPELDKVTATHLYRIAQESVNNAIKHGKAKTIYIKLTCDENAIHLEVKDNGCGMTGEFKPGTGLGLRTMNYRAKLIDASLAITPRSTGGITVKCTLRRKLQPAE